MFTKSSPLKAISLLLILSVIAKNVDAKYYSMYVWTDEFNVDAPACGGVYPISNDVCFTHAWETSAARSHLWSSTRIPGREVTRIFLSDTKNRIQYDGKNADSICDPALMDTLAEAHAIGVEVYALYADSDANFSEKGRMQFVKQFNDICGTAASYFDGVSVNNEYFTQIKSCSNADNVQLQLSVLNNLNETAFNAGTLPLHFSVSWNWDCCSCSSGSYAERLLTWNGVEKSAVEHMIDIADSVDVQVAWNTGSNMIARSSRPYQYWKDNKMGSTSSTAFYVTAYTNPTSDCRTSFAPHKKGSLTPSDSCATGNRTEAGMFAAFDELIASEVYARGSIHYHGGVFSSGMAGWPKHG